MNLARLFAALQRIVPQHTLSRLVGRLAASENPAVRLPLVRAFARAYGVNLAEAERSDLAAYRSFNDFFTRALRPGARPIDPDPASVVSPADGAVSQSGTISDGQMLQAKGIRYAFAELVDVCARPSFEGGAFATVYLSPSDYHRVHLPVAGRLVRSVAIPGKLFSVNAATEREVPGLFAVNERLVLEFETELGRMLVVLVGAMIVASIETVWGGPPSPYRHKQVQTHDLPFEKGAEIGRFLLGSTVIVVFEHGRIRLGDDLVPGAVVRMGQKIGQVA
ncbi:MAG: phosphatidylserine decarboxylase [Rhodothermales bacterium]|nr:phosphatidylserine decarboxylase [Rhodothermales bacterium]